jgi:hypothetical protein
MEYKTLTKFTAQDIVPGTTMASTVFSPSKFYLVERTESFSVTPTGQIAHQGQELWNSTRFVQTGDVIGGMVGSNLFSAENTSINVYVLKTVGRQTEDKIQPQEDLGRSSHMHATLSDIAAIKNPA